MYRVMKPIKTDQGVVPVGTIVDASSWRNVRALVNMRYLSPVAEQVSVAEPAPKVVKAAKPKVEKAASSEE